ncbi:MAG: aminotransferase class I/II-fold pyridoxal phosphate-dependent enzyme [Ruminococcaceae bacterium]|nr:aminotransferase class I/II-fold pyridoxal phosphate-dependent enzyme [Oscillospiraceae bacterium]
MKDTKLDTMLRSVSAKGRVPFHMPGHKRSGRYDYLNGLGAAMDMTEIDGFDNLHDPTGILRDGMELLSRVYGSKRSFFLINGSTGGILAAVRCAVPFGGEVIMARNCHKAVYNAAELVGARPVYIDPPTDDTFGFCLDVSPYDVEKALEDHSAASAVIVTSPTYDGVVSDISAIAKVCHGRGVPLIVDEAHGAHLGFLDERVRGAVSSGADIVIQSFHKTLPSLTQTAVAHIGGDLVDAERYAAELSVFETSSPSYLLMSSLDGCTRLLADDGARDAFFGRWREVLGYGEGVLSSLLGVRLFGGNTVSAERIYGYDRAKWVISADGMTGVELAAVLRRHNIEPEMAAAGYVLLMPGADTEKGDIDLLCTALRDGACGARGGPLAEDGKIRPVTARKQAMTPHEARLREKETVALSELPTDAVSGDYVFAYPPGIPVVVPGEVITEEIKEALYGILRLDLNPATLRGAFRGHISVVK